MAGLSKIVPLLILFVVISIAGFIGYQIYLWSNELADKASKKMAKKNMSFTKDGGLRVGVKELKDESYADKTQNVLVNVWSNAAFPAYKSSLGWNSTQSKPSQQQQQHSSSSAQKAKPIAASSSSSRYHAPAPAPAQRPVANREASVPGGW